MKKEVKKNRILTIFIFLLLCIWMLPIYYMVISTFKTGIEVAASPLSLPKRIEFDNYVKAFYNMQFPRALLNTIFIAVMTVIINLSISVLAAYTLARRKNGVNNIIYFFFLMGMMIPVQMGLSSLYRIISFLKLINNPFAVILINAAGGSISSIFLIKSFIASTIPIEIEEAARIDGCGIYDILFRVVLPLLRPVLATVTIIVMLGSWNDYLNPSLFLQTRERGVILQEVYRNVGQFSVDWASLFPMLVLGILPLTIIYIFMQRFIIGGVTGGSIKG